METQDFLWVNQDGQLVCVDTIEGYIFLCKGLKEFQSIYGDLFDTDICWHVDHIATLPVSLIEKMFRL